MGKRRWRPRITVSEAKEIYDLGYTIRAHWVGQMEGTEYMPALMGGTNLAFLKSPRACYNFIKRHASENAKAGAPEALAQMRERNGER